MVDNLTLDDTCLNQKYEVEGFGIAYIAKLETPIPGMDGEGDYLLMTRFVGDIPSIRIARVSSLSAKFKTTNITVYRQPPDAKSCSFGDQGYDVLDKLLIKYTQVVQG